MSAKEKKTVQSTPAVEAAVEVPVLAPAAMPISKLLDIDKMALDLAKSRAQTVLAEAKTAAVEAQNAELGFKYVVLQIYMKYGLTDKDAINDSGEIIRGGAAQAG